jgi:hypothetical protein
MPITIIVIQSNKAKSSNFIGFGGAFLQGAVQIQTNSIVLS